MTRFQEEKLKYLSAHPCVDCGESDPIVLCFDHRDQTKKKRLVNTLHSLKYEAPKCDVRCANCHMRLRSSQAKNGAAIARSRGKRLGRPPVHPYTREEIMKLRRQGKTIRWIANNTRTSVGFVCNVLRSQKSSIKNPTIEQNASSNCL